MSPFVKLIIAVTLIGLFLHTGIRYFLGETEELASNLDVRSLAHLRDNASEPGEAGKIEAIVEDEKEDGQTTDDTELEPAIPDGDIDEDVDNDKDESLMQPAVNDDDATSTESSAEARDAARQERLRSLGLLPAQRPPPTIALDVALLVSGECVTDLILPQGLVPLEFRFNSPTLRGDSLNRLESLVAVYRDCDGGAFSLTENPLGKIDATPSLTQMRLDEVKYFFLQHSVPISDIEFPDLS